MKVFHWRPSGVLGDHVDRIWGWESDGYENVALPILMPGTGAEVFFHYRSPFLLEDTTGTRRATPIAHLVCARRKSMRLIASSDVGFVSIRFRAGSIYRYTRVTPADLADNMLSTEQLWGTAGRQVTEALIGSNSQAERVQTIERFLLDRLGGDSGDQLVERAVRHIYYRCSSISISSLARSLGIGRRQLERRVRSVTGQSPVEIRSASRFQKVVRDMLLNPSADLLGTLLDHGYYDQSHFSRACSNLGISSPRATISAARAMTHFYNPPLRSPDSVEGCNQRT